MRTRLSLLLLPAFAAACTTAPAAGPAPMSPPPAPPAMSMSMSMGGFPTGTYTTTITEGDIPASAPADMRSMMGGAWVIAFGANGHAMVTFNGRQVVDAPYQINGNELVLTADDTGEYACHSNARYTWHAAGSELHLTRVEDACDGRVVALTAHPLVRR